MICLFFSIVWDIMERVDGLQLKERTLESKQVLSEMTSDEVEFRVNVEDMLSESANAVDRQICVEVRKFCNVCCPYPHKLLG